MLVAVELRSFQVEIYLNEAGGEVKRWLHLWNGGPHGGYPKILKKNRGSQNFAYFDGGFEIKYDKISHYHFCW